MRRITLFVYTEDRTDLKLFGCPNTSCHIVRWVSTCLTLQLQGVIKKYFFFVYQDAYRLILMARR